MPELFLHKFKWFYVLLYSSHNLTLVICLQRVYSVRSIDRTLSGATTPGQSGPRNNGNEEVFHIPQISKAVSSSDGLMSYQNTRCGWGSYPFAEMQLVYSLTLVDCFGLVSLFNGISTFVGYLMPKLFSLKNSSGTI